MFNMVRRYWIAALFAGFCLLATSMASSMASQAQVRRGWEYKRLTSTLTGSLMTGQKWIKRIGDKTFDDSVSSEDLLNALGAEGWELVGFTTASDTWANSDRSGVTTDYAYILKRPK